MKTTFVVKFGFVSFFFVLVVVLPGCTSANSYEQATGSILVNQRIIPSSDTERANIMASRLNAITTSDGWLIRGLSIAAPEQALPFAAATNYAITPLINQWGVANPPNSYVKPKNRKQAWESVYRQLKTWTTNGDLSRLNIEMAEPELFTKNPSFEQYNVMVAKAKNSEFIAPNQDRPREVTFTDGPSPHWPAPKPYNSFWYMNSNYSQLNKARKIVENAGATNNLVKVVLLDTGARPDFDVIPERYDSIHAFNLFDSGNDSTNWDTHGTATTGILAGGRIQSTNASSLFSGEADGYLGGDPWANVSTYRISSWVVSVGALNSKIAEGIHKAVDNGADVISISNGGLPDCEWAEAVNYAYEHGTAIFAASGDYENFFNLFQTPRLLVFPAAFSRVVAVPGVTYDYRSYGEIPNFWSFLKFTDFSSYFMRGNYGPAFMMTNAVCGFTPNIPWVGDAYYKITLNGAGTSSSAPQVAAAAALWLQYHHNDQGLREMSVWRSHKKVDAVYNALKSKAKHDALKPFPDRTHFGLGTLAAADALSVGYSEDLTSYPDAEVELDQLLALITGWFPIENAYRMNSRGFDPTMRSMEIEALQVAYTSRHVQSLLEGITNSVSEITPLMRKRISNYILTSPDASKTLKESGYLLQTSK